MVYMDMLQKHHNLYQTIIMLNVWNFFSGDFNFLRKRNSSMIPNEKWK